MRWIYGKRENKMNEITDEYLLERGYKQYKPTPVLDSDLVVAKFQKRFDDDFGKKYFIDVVKWSHDFVPEYHRDKWWKPFTYSYEVYTTMFENEDAMKIEFYSSWSLEQVEEFMEDFFDKMKPNYYEDWDEYRATRPERKK